MKNLTPLLFIVLLTLSYSIVNANEAPKTEAKTAEQLAEEKRCTVPAFAKAIGHEELWKKHNGCPTSENQKDD